MAQPHKTMIDISPDAIKRVVLVLVGFWALTRLRTLILYLLFALLFAVALNPLIAFFQSKGLKRGSAMSLALVLIVGVLFGLLGIIVGSLVTTFVDFVDELPTYIESFRQYDFLSGYVDDIQENVNDIDIQSVIQSGLDQSNTLISGFSKVFEATLFTFFFTVYMLLERDYLLRIMRKVTPKSWQNRSNDIEAEFVEVVGGYIRGQLLTSFLVGLTTYIFLRILNVPNALALAIIAGFTDIIPVIGGLLGIVPVAIIAVTISPWTAIVAVLLMQTYSTISNYFIRPKIFGSSLEMSPFIVTVATMAGLLLFGIPGIILALPVAAMMGYILTKYYDIPILDEPKESES